MSRDLAVIGDVHGRHDLLARMLDSRHLRGRHVVLVGDVIDRGPDSAKVLDLICELIDGWPPGATLLRGNHEQALLDFLDTGQAAAFLRNGGMHTVASYYTAVPRNVVAAFRQDLPEAHKTLLKSSATYLESEEVLVSHMGYDPSYPSARDLQAMVLDAHFDLFQGPVGLQKFTVCGHYAQRGGQPYVTDSLICIDTGCGIFPNAPLSAVLLPERTIVQVEPEGRIA